MASDSAADLPTPEAAGDEEPPRSLLQRVLHEARETILTIAVFVPFWLVFSTFVYELRSIPSESMIPALQVGDRVAVAKWPYGYNRNSIPFSIGQLFMGDDPNNVEQRWLGGMPSRGDVVVFQHPHNPRVMIKRVIGLPGDKIEVRGGRLYIGVAGGDLQLIERQPVRDLKYVSADRNTPSYPKEYREKLPGEKDSHLIHEFSDEDRLDNTPVFTVPAGTLFMMGDNRDNSEDSRAPSGHPDMARRQLQFDALHRGDDTGASGWRNLGGWDSGEKAIGFVPVDHLIGRADTVLFTLYNCKATRAQREAGFECASGRLWKGL